MTARTLAERGNLEDAILRANAVAVAFSVLLDVASQSIVHHKMNGRHCYIIGAPDWYAIHELGQSLCSDVIRVDAAYFGEVATGGRYPEEWSTELIATLRT